MPKMNWKTQFVADALRNKENAETQLYLSIYFKMCALKNKKPFYGHFIAVLGIKKVINQVSGAYVYAASRDLNHDQLSNVMLKLYTEWRRNPFSREELNLIGKYGLEENVKFVLTRRS